MRYYYMLESEELHKFSNPFLEEISKNLTEVSQNFSAEEDNFCEELPENLGEKVAQIVEHENAVVEAFLSKCKKFIFVVVNEGEFVYISDELNPEISVEEAVRDFLDEFFDSNFYDVTEDAEKGKEFLQNKIEEIENNF